MLTGLKLSCLASKIVLYRLEHNAKVPIELLRNKINIPTDRAQRVEKKVLCQAIMYNLGVMVIKMSKSSFFGFSAYDSTNQSQSGQNIQVHVKDLI